MSDEFTKKVHHRRRISFIIKIAIIMAAALVVMHFGRLLGVVRWAFNIIMPFLVGLGIAYIWNLIMEPIERRLFSNRDSKIIQKIKRPLSVVISLVIILGILALVLYLIIPQLYNSINVIAKALPVLADDLREWFLNVTAGLEWTEGLRENIEDLNIDWSQFTNRAAEFLRSSVGGVLGKTMNLLSGVVGFFVAAFTAILFAVYILFGKEKLAGQMDCLSLAYMKPDHRRKLRYVSRVFDDTFSKFFEGQLLDAFIVGALLFIALLIFRMPYALTISVVVMVTALIPMVGSFIGGGVGFLMIAVEDFRQALIFLVILVVVQQLEGDLIYPKIVGDSVGLPGIWVFSAVIVGGAIAGPLGMLIGVPFVAAMYKILRNDVRARLDESPKPMDRA